MFARVVAATFFGLIVTSLLLNREVIAQTKTCTEEFQACRSRCVNEYKLKDDELQKCKTDSCGVGFGRCIETGFWVVSKTGKMTPLEKK